MKREKIFHFNNTSEKIWERCYISCGKNSEKYHKSLTKASKVVFTIANASVSTLLYKDSFMNKSLDFGLKKYEQAKSKDKLAVPQNLKTKCLGKPLLK